MAVHIPLAPVREGQAWLLSCAPDPAAVQRAWDAQQLAPIPTGTHWLVGEAQLSRSLDAARRLGSHPVGPVLTDIRTSLAWWLLPAGLANELDDVTGLTVHPPGWELRCPPVVHSLAGRWWLALPDGSGHLTDPTLLAAAFGPGGYRTNGEASA
ncbi:hypothetical protein ACF1AB_16620 [Streptomyces sp. NPDC014846]|uniref:hypothetical protein n=1 Tax=Streptomyces sp. NPDC014846 TaxID=3364922 RepID=UPI0036FFFA0B